jgi:hypothetical protein
MQERSKTENPASRATPPRRRVRPTPGPVDPLDLGGGVDADGRATPPILIREIACRTAVLVAGSGDSSSQRFFETPWKRIHQTSGAGASWPWRERLRAGMRQETLQKAQVWSARRR